jgi:teichuronic acid exporter
MVDVKKIKSKAITASMWAVISKFSLLFTQFIIGIILARLLKPSDFGLIALTTVFITISGAVTDGGFETALIQKKELSSIQINTAFYLNIILGCIMTLLIFVLSPYIATFFNEPQLKNILRVLSISLPLEALGQTQRTLLMRELDFKKISVSQILSSIVSGLAGILLAYYGYGVWALVYSTILALIIRVTWLWIYSSWYPQIMFSYSSLSNIVPFGLNVLTTSILFFFVQQFNSLVVGKFYNERDLGLYSRGMKFPEIIISIIQSVILKMALPLFSKFQDEREKLDILLNKTNVLVAFITFPLLSFVFLNAKEIVILLLTPKWIESVIYVKLFCIIKLFDPFISVQQELLLAKSKSKLYLLIFGTTSVIEIVTIILFAKYGINYILCAVIVNKILQYIIYLAIESKGINNRVFKYLKLFISYLFISLIVIVMVRWMDNWIIDIIKDRYFQKLVIDFLLGVVLYSFLYYKFKQEDLLSFKNIISTINFPKFRFTKS